MKVQPVILSGGAGTRLWPLSREQYPKQLLSFHGEYTLLQDTVQRLEGLSKLVGQLAEPIIVCNEQHRFLVAEQLRSIDCHPEAILLEPIGRNTAPALTVAALASMNAGDDGRCSGLAVPVDHPYAHDVGVGGHPFQSAIRVVAIAGNDNFLCVRFLSRLDFEKFLFGSATVILLFF